MNRNEVKEHLDNAISKTSYTITKTYTINKHLMEFIIINDVKMWGGEEINGLKSRISEDIFFDSYFTGFGNFGNGELLLQVTEKGAYEVWD